MRFNFLIPTLLLVPTLAVAEVNLKSGGYSVTAQDIEFKSDSGELQLRRTFNSLSPEAGWFGWGWGSLFETRLIAMPDGTAAVRENGSGMNRFYDPANNAPESDNAGAIVKAATARDKLTAKAAAALRDALQKSEELRMLKVQQYGIRIDHPAGTAWKGRSCGKLLRVRNVYQRTDCNGANDYFDEQGRLLGHEEGEYIVAARYDGERVVSIEDSAGKRILLTWTPAGRISKAQGVGGRTAEYGYNARGELLSMTGGNLDRLDYTYDTNHRLTSIRLIDTTSWQMRYNDDGRIASLRDRNGKTEWYEYGINPADPNRYWTRVTQEMGAGNKPVTKTHEWSIAESATGTRKVAEYSSSTGEGDAQIDTRYDDKGRVTRTIRDGKVEMYGYDKETGKLILILNKDSRIEFGYNSAGLVERAEDSKKAQSIKLIYGDNSTISNIQYADRNSGESRKLAFKYNAMKKPVEIRLDGVGKIDIVYDADGKLSRVYADPQGSNLAAIITKVFGQLKAMMAPTGLQLGL